MQMERNKETKKQSLVTGEMNILRKEGVINLKLLENSLDSYEQFGSPEILLSKILEVDGVLD